MRLPEASGPSFVSSHCIQETTGGERDWPGLAGGAGSIRSGRRGVPPENNLTFHPSGVSLEGSELVFLDLVQLICAYCHTR